MIVSVKGQALLFITTVVLGFIIGFFYDILRVTRNIISHNNLLIQLEDILYWITVTFIMFAVMLEKNYGEIRAFSIIGAFLGMILYFLTISNLFMKISITLFNIIRKIIFTLLEIMFFPIRLIIKPLKYPYYFIIKHSKNTLKKIYKYFKKKINKVKKVC